MPLYRLTLEYDGTDLYGSQVQANGRTVQGELEQAIQTLTGTGTRLAFAGRTDRGVHAIGQVASGEIPWNGSPQELRRSLNGVGPADIVVSDVALVESGFHARFSAMWREYRYRVIVAETEPVLMRRYAWWRRSPIDAGLAQDACDALVGTHSFGSFASGGWSQALTPEQMVRTVYVCQWRQQQSELIASGQAYELRIVASGFLPQMVRNITSAVVRVGSGDAPAAWIREVLDAGDRGAMQAGAPPQGLALWRVGYTEFDNGSEA